MPKGDMRRRSCVRAYLHDVALNDLQMRRMRSALNPALQLQHLRSRDKPWKLKNRPMDVTPQSPAANMCTTQDPLQSGLALGPLLQSDRLPSHKLRQRPAHHARVDLDGDDALGHLQKLHCQVACAGPHLQHHVGALDAGLVHDGLHHQRVLQNVLPFALVELDTCAVCGRAGVGAN